MPAPVEAKQGHNAAPTEEHDDHLEHVTHTTHQGKLGVHVAEEVGHTLHELRQTLAARQTAAALVEEGAAISRVLGSAAEDVSRVTHHETAELRKASEVLERFHALQKKAQQAAGAQSAVARQVNKMLAAGTPVGDLARARDRLDAASRMASEVYKQVRQAGPAAQAARLAVRSIAQAAKTRAASPTAVQRALRAVANTKTGAKAVELTHQAAQSRTAALVTALAHSKAVQVGANVLVVAAASLDAVKAYRPDATVLGNIVRVDGQLFASAVTYAPTAFVGARALLPLSQASATAAGWVMLPILATEALYWHKPHVTGTLQAAVQVAGVIADGVTGGIDAFDRSVGTLDAEMKNGTYGAVIKGANYFGQALSDKGVGHMVDDAVAYWSKVSPSQTWRDTKDIWTWLSE